MNLIKDKLEKKLKPAFDLAPEHIYNQDGELVKNSTTSEAGKETAESHN